MIGKSFSFEIIRNLAKTTAIGFLFFGVSFVVGFTLSKAMLPNDRAIAANVIMDQPTYNWFVCEDLGMGTIPGVPDSRQILRLCHNQGWEIRAYCLQPSIPAPPIGQSCSHTPEGTYWCGDAYQLLEEFALDVTPTPTLVPTETNTSIPTQTTQPSATFTPVYTASATFTPTEIPSDTPPPTSTPRLTRTFTLTPSPTDTPIPSVTGTQLATQTPASTQTDVPGASITPPVAPSQTPQVSSTATAVSLTETTSPTLDVTPTEALETPVPTVTRFANSPTPTPRTRPGGSGNLGIVSLLAVSIGILLFAIGFLGLLLLQKSSLALHVPQILSVDTRPGSQKTISLNRWLLLFVLLSMISLVGYLLSVWVPQLMIGQPRSITVSAISLPGFENHLTATPFQPRHPTPAYSQDNETERSPTFDFQQISFAPQSGGVQISIDPPTSSVNQGKPISLSFIPSETCEFGDQKACVSSHLLDQQNLVFLTIHSGFGGEGQAFRHVIEGTGINKAAYSLEQINANLTALQNAQVSLATNGDEIGGFTVRGIIRIPAAQVDTYFSLPIEDALEFVASLNPGAWSNIDKNQALLIFETCGWKIPAEPGADGVSDTTGSVYIVVIQPTW